MFGQSRDRPLMQVRVFMDDAQNPRFITIGQALKTTGIKDGDAVEALDFASRELSYSTFPIYLRILIGIGSVIVVLTSLAFP